MTFATAFQLRIRHDYYPDGQCADFEIVPSAATSRLLQNHRTLCRVLPDGVRVLMTLGVGNRPLIPLLPNAVLTFHLILRSQDFALFTDLTPFKEIPAPVFVPGKPPAPPSVLVLQNRTATTTETLLMPPGSATARFTLAEPFLAGTQSKDFGVAGLPATTRVDLEPAARAIKITTDANAAARSFTVTYPIKPRRPTGTFADVEIAHPPEPPPAGTAVPEFQIQFSAWKARWKYLLVTGAGLPVDSFSIESATGPTFIRSPADPSDLLTGTLRQQYPESDGYHLTAFVSDTPVPCQNRSPVGLRLKQGADTVMDSLPSPSPRNVCTIGADPGLFQILKRMIKP